MVQTVYIGADHAGFAVKSSIIEQLEMHGFHVEDLGAHNYDPNDDYPAYAQVVANAVLDHEGSLGVLACGNAEGICIAANKFDGIRAGIGYSVAAAKSLRNDDLANIVCIPGRIKLEEDPLRIVEAFLETPPSDAARHLRRMDQVTSIEENGRV